MPLFKKNDIVFVVTTHFTEYEGQKAIVTDVKRLANYTYLYRLYTSDQHIIWFFEHQLMPVTEMSSAIYGV